uniref:VWFA domain-containing protein n=1 Tax=Panagrolaimus sp. PS1159 TaxID=55785 RepID=A0AC35F9A2_9BILA
MPITKKHIAIIVAAAVAACMVIAGIVVTIVLVTRKSKDSSESTTTLATSTTAITTPSTIELTILISLCVGEKQPKRYKRSDYAENVNTTNKILQGVVENLKDDINSKKLAIIFEPYNDNFTDPTDTYYEYDTIKNEINNLTSYQTIFNGNPNQTSNMERILKNIKQTRRKRDTTNINKSNQIFHFAPPRNFYQNNEIMHKDIKQARNIIEKIIGNNEPVTIIGLDLDEEELDMYGNITFGFFKNSTLDDIINNLTNFINKTIYSLLPTTTTAVDSTTTKLVTTTTKVTEITSTPIVTKPSTTSTTIPPKMYYNETLIIAFNTGYQNDDTSFDDLQNSLNELIDALHFNGSLAIQILPYSEKRGNMSEIFDNPLTIKNKINEILLKSENITGKNPSQMSAATALPTSIFVSNKSNKYITEPFKTKYCFYSPPKDAYANPAAITEDSKQAGILISNIIISSNFALILMPNMSIMDYNISTTNQNFIDTTYDNITVAVEFLNPDQFFISTTAAPILNATIFTEIIPNPEGTKINEETTESFDKITTTFGDITTTNSTI